MLTTDDIKLRQILGDSGWCLQGTFTLIVERVDLDRVVDKLVAAGIWPYRVSGVNGTIILPQGWTQGLPSD